MSRQQIKAWCLLGLSGLALAALGAMWALCEYEVVEGLFPYFHASLALVLMLAATVKVADKTPRDERDRLIGLRASLVGAATTLGLLLVAATAMFLAWEGPHQITVDSDLPAHLVLVALWFGCLAASVAMLLAYRQGGADGQA